MVVVTVLGCVAYLFATFSAGLLFLAQTLQTLLKFVVAAGNHAANDLGRRKAEEPTKE